MTQTDVGHPFIEREAVVLDIETVPIDAALAVQPSPSNETTP